MTKDELDSLYRQLADRGFLIEAGYAALRFTAIAKDAPQVQIDEMRFAFFAGAQHLFGSIMSMLDPGAEATPKDMERMELISRELSQWLAEIQGDSSKHEYQRASGHVH
jgi:hypothetical protein